MPDYSSGLWGATSIPEPRPQRNIMEDISNITSTIANAVQQQETRKLAMQKAKDELDFRRQDFRSEQDHRQAMEANAAGHLDIARQKDVRDVAGEAEKRRIAMELANIDPLAHIETQIKGISEEPEIAPYWAEVGKRKADPNVRAGLVAAAPMAEGQAGPPEMPRDARMYSEDISTRMQPALRSLAERKSQEKKDAAERRQSNIDERFAKLQGERYGKDVAEVKALQSPLEGLRDLINSDRPIPGTIRAEPGVLGGISATGRSFAMEHKPQAMYDKGEINTQQVAMPILNRMMKEISGGAVTTDEAARNLAARGIFIGALEDRFRSGAKKVLQEFDNMTALKRAKYPGEVVQTVESRGGVVRVPGLPDQAGPHISPPGATMPGRPGPAVKAKPAGADPEKAAALRWAKEHPGDPRAVKIMLKLGER